MDLKSVSIELELGEAIEEVLRTEVLINFAIENYYAKSNPLFFEWIFSEFYFNIKQSIDELTAATEDAENETELQICLLNYREKISSAKQRAIELFLDKCKEIVSAEGLDFDPVEWFKQQPDSKVAIIEVMKEIRSREEKNK